MQEGFSVPNGNRDYNVRLSVDPGACGFICTVTAVRQTDRRVRISINGSDCSHIALFARAVEVLDIFDMFKPTLKNPVFAASQAAGCHPQCPLPLAVLKAAESALNLALKKDVCLVFL